MGLIWLLLVVAVIVVAAAVVVVVVVVVAVVVVVVVVMRIYKWMWVNCIPITGSKGQFSYNIKTVWGRIMLSRRENNCYVLINVKPLLVFTAHSTCRTWLHEKCSVVSGHAPRKFCRKKSVKKINWNRTYGGCHTHSPLSNIRSKALPLSVSHKDNPEMSANQWVGSG